MNGLLSFFQRQWRRTFPKKVPYLQQLTTVECGAACLAMILSYYGRPTSVAEARDACVVGRDGLRASTIAQAARQFGLEVRAFSSDIDALASVQLPAIIHWELSHFVVLESWTSKGALIVDPAIGRNLVSVADFSARFTGVVLTFQPTPELKPARQHLSESFSFYRQLRESWRNRKAERILLTIGLSIADNSLLLAFPLLLKIVVDAVIPLRSPGLLYAVVVMALLMSLLRLFVLQAKTRVAQRNETDAEVGGQINFVQHLFRLPLPFFQQRSSGDLLMRVQGDTHARSGMAGSLVTGTLDAVVLCLCLLALVVAWPIFGLTLLVFAILVLYVNTANAGQSEQLAQEEMRRASQQQGYLLEALRSASSLKASASEANAISRWRNLLLEQANVKTRRMAFIARRSKWGSALTEIAPVTLFLSAMMNVLKEQSTLGTGLALGMASFVVLAGARKLANLRSNYRNARSHFERAQDILEASPEQVKTGLLPAPVLQGTVELRNVSFRFNPNSPWIVRNVSCVVRAGEKVAIVGSSGSGKSTLSMLMIGIYQPTEGEILFDGHPLSQLDLTELRRQIGVVLQEHFLFGGSIRQNIVFGAPALTLEQVATAAHLAGIHEEIIKMPMGYETVIYEGGSNLSGGQRQRLLIARALASNPRLLLLDEATSHLDTVTERIVDSNLSALSITRIVIAHRLSTVQNADKILVLASGALLEQGTHMQLKRNGGEYEKLCSMDCYIQTP